MWRHGRDGALGGRQDADDPRPGLSWKETARRFRTSWDTVFRCVEHAVRWGLEYRSLDGIGSIGVDELSWRKRHKYLTLVYQLDHGRRRLLHIDLLCSRGLQNAAIF